MAKKTAAIIVFGDIGRSPRMQNHALEFTKNTDYYVYLIGYLGIKFKLHKKMRLMIKSN